MLYPKRATFIVAMTLMASWTYASPALMTIRNSESDLAEYCKSFRCPREIIETDTKEFANGNTFVRFKGSVAGKDILIVTPSVLDSNQFMELLIKIRTSKTDFANSISLMTPNRTSEISVVDANGEPVLNSELVKSLLNESGLSKLNGRKLSTKSLPKPGKSKKSILVDSGTNSSLSQELSKNLSIPSLSYDQALSHLSGGSANVIVVSSVADPHNLSFLKMLDQIHRIKSRGAKVTLVAPYLPYARSDKKDQMGVAVIGRLAADMIEKSGADAVNFVRAHAPQSQGFFRIPSIQTMGRKTINGYLKTQGVEQIISPDAGFQKDATLYADELGLPVSVINKQRDLQTGESKLHDMSGPSVHGRVVAIIDDETASGGTLGKAAEFLKKQGAVKVVAVVTHLAGNASQALNSPFIDAIAVTDTFEIKSSHPKLKVLSIANEMGQDLKVMLGLVPACQKSYKD